MQTFRRTKRKTRERSKGCNYNTQEDYKKSEIEILGSTAVLAEIDLIPNEEKREAVRSLVEKSYRIIWVRKTI